MEQATLAAVEHTGARLRLGARLLPRTGGRSSPPGWPSRFSSSCIFSGLGSPAGMVRVMATKSAGDHPPLDRAARVYNLGIYLPLVVICIAARSVLPRAVGTRRGDPRLAFGTTQGLAGRLAAGGPDPGRALRRGHGDGQLVPRGDLLGRRARRLSAVPPPRRRRRRAAPALAPGDGRRGGDRGRGEPAAGRVSPGDRRLQRHERGGDVRGPRPDGWPSGGGRPPPGPWRRCWPARPRCSPCSPPAGSWPGRVTTR